MKKLVEKFQEIERELSEERGRFNLFALFLREESANKWDLLVSADWIDEDKSDSLKVISKKVQEKLSKKEIVNLSRIVLIEENNPSLVAIQKAINVEHESAEIKDDNFFGLEIKHAFVITSGRSTAKAG